MLDRAERCTIETAELILGIKRRNIQARAARGEIPGAGKIGHLWTFDVALLRRYVRERQQQCNGKLRQDATGAVISFGAALFIKGRERRWSLQTSDPKIAAKRRAAGKERAIADLHDDGSRSFAEVVDAWIVKQVSPKTTKRYACSLDQLEPYLNGRSLSAIDGRLVAEIIRERSASGITSATVKRDLVALSSVLNFAIDQGWCDDNPVLPRLGRIKERRDPIVLPQRQHIDLVISRCPGMIADIVRVAMATGARENELLEARRDGIDHDRRQMTIIGKRNKRRVIDLNPFGAHDLLSSLVPYAGRPLLFWHSDGESYKNFASQFRAIVSRINVWATENGVEFRPFRFHDLRHWHAVQWLKDGRSIHDLQHRLGHSSIKTTEMYCEYLTPDEQRVAKQQTGTFSSTTNTAGRSANKQETVAAS